MGYYEAVSSAEHNGKSLFYQNNVLNSRSTIQYQQPMPCPVVKQNGKGSETSREPYRNCTKGKSTLMTYGEQTRRDNGERVCINSFVCDSMINCLIQKINRPSGRLN